MLIWKDAKDILAKYSGSGGYCPSDEVDLFVRKTLQFLLISGASQDLRRFDFVANQGWFTVPEEIEAVIKIKINGKVANSWDKWFSYHNQNTLEGDNCFTCPSEAIFEDPNYYATAYDVPSCGSRVGVLGHCNEDCEAHIIIQGNDRSGREIFTYHKGEQIAGEYLSIVKGKLIYSQVEFAQITNVIKTKTKGYATLYSLNSTTNQRLFLSDYSPITEQPTYRRYKLTSPACCPYVNVSTLARIRLKSAYSDLEKIPFENLLAIELAGQMINSNFNNDAQSATNKIQLLDTVIEREQSHKKVQTGIPINISPITGPGRVRNIVGGWGLGLGGFWSGRGGR